MKTLNHLNIKQILIVVLSFIFLFSARTSTLKAAESDVLWANTSTTGAGSTYFYDVSSDSLGNTYAVGLSYGTATHDFGNGVTVAGVVANQDSPIIVKYNAAGQTQWAKTVSAATQPAIFFGISTDADGNSYVVGEIVGNYAYDFGNGVTTPGTSPQETWSVVIVKYNSDGIAQWANTSSLAVPGQAVFKSISRDPSGNLYAVGFTWGTGTYDFGNGVTVAGGATGAYGGLIVKYNASGTAEWAKVISGNESSYTKIATDSSGNIYASGYVQGNALTDFGGTTLNPATTSVNPVVTKYTPAGSASWVRSTILATGQSEFKDISVDGSGNIYLSGYIQSGGTYNFGSGVSVISPNTYQNPIIMKYDSTGVPLWAKTFVSGVNHVPALGIATDTYGNSFLVGFMMHDGTYGLGNGITITNPTDVYRPYIFRYDSSGIPQWAKTIEVSPSSSWFEKVAIDSSGNAVAVGYIDGNSQYTIGNGVTVTAFGTGYNILAAKYESHPPQTLTYTAGTGGTISGMVTQYVNLGGDGTSVTAVGDTGYAFNQWSDGSLENPRQDSNITGDINVSAEFINSRTLYETSASIMQNEVDRGFITYTGASTSLADSFTFVVNYTFVERNNQINFPAGTVVTKTGGGQFDLTAFSMGNPTDIALEHYSKLAGVTRIGVSGVRLLFSKNYTINLSVNPLLNGMTVSVYHHEESGQIDINASCTVSNGICSFQMNHATVFLVPDFTSPGEPPATCTRSRPSRSPDLFQVTTQKGSVRLFFTPVPGANKYLVFYGHLNGERRFSAIFDALNDNKGVQSVLIGGLDSGTTYYFTVSGLNECVEGPWSVSVPAKPNKRGNVYSYVLVIQNRIKKLVNRFI